jgi:hypothetical protein
MDTTLINDIIKILLDKALLGLVAALFGFYLARILEDHRSRNAYYQAIALQRVESCRTIVTMVYEHHEKVLGLYDSVIAINKKHLAGEAPTEDDTRQAYEYVEHYNKHKKVLIPLATLMSPEVMKAYLRYSEETNKVTDVVRNMSLTVETDKDQLDMALFVFLAACYASIVSDPFAGKK